MGQSFVLLLIEGTPIRIGCPTTLFDKPVRVDGIKTSSIILFYFRYLQQAVHFFL